MLDKFRNLSAYLATIAFWIILPIVLFVDPESSKFCVAVVWIAIGIFINFIAMHTENILFGLFVILCEWMKRKAGGTYG